MDESFQSIIHKILEIYEKYQIELETIETHQTEDAIVLQQSSTETDELVRPDKSLQIEEAFVLKETHQLQDNLIASHPEDVIVHKQSSTETEGLVGSDESLQIEAAYVLEETLLSQQIFQQSDSLDPLMTSTKIKKELSKRECSYENSVFIIDQSPEKPIVIEESFVIGLGSQTIDTDESIIGKAERKACKRLDDLQYE